VPIVYAPEMDCSLMVVNGIALLITHTDLFITPML
jgi:hypothetical protein